MKYKFSPDVRSALTAILIFLFASGCLATAMAISYMRIPPRPEAEATSTPDPMYTKDWGAFPIVVRARSGQLLTDWYGDEILWPENPYTPSGHWFVLTPAVRETWTSRAVEGGLYSNPHWATFGATVWVLYQHTLEESYLSELAWDDINIPNDAFDKKYCTVYIRLRYESWVGKDCEIVEFDWGYETGQFIKLSQAIEIGYLFGEKDVRAGDLWIPIDEVDHVNTDKPWADQISDLTPIEHGELIINK